MVGKWGTGAGYPGRSCMLAAIPWLLVLCVRRASGCVFQDSLCAFGLVCDVVAKQQAVGHLALLHCRLC